jgi:hypothetical protein
MFLEFIKYFITYSHNKMIYMLAMIILKECSINKNLLLLDKFILLHNKLVVLCAISHFTPFCLKFLITI